MTRLRFLFLFKGDVIIIENSFIKHVVEDSEYNRCANCLDQNFLNLFPCCQCTRTMFCSEDCYQEAWKRFHKHECKIIDGIFSLNSMPVVTAVRAAVQSITMFDDPKELEKLIKDINVETENAFTLDYSQLTEQNLFRAAYSLATNESCQKISVLFGFAKQCASVWHLLITHTYLHLLLKTKDTEDLFLNVLFHFFEVAVTNAHSLGQTVGSTEQYGSAIFPLCSLLNHSCAPNILKLIDKSTVFVIAKQFIKAGEQIFDSYGQHLHHAHAKLQSRQKTFKSQYIFDCKCNACVRDYPLIEEIPHHGRFFTKFLNDRERLDSFDKGFAKKKLKEYKKHLIEYQKKYPCFEVLASEDIFTHCLWALMFGAPLKMQLKPVLNG